MLDIIVTHYKEPWEIGKPLFDILALQRGIDFSNFRVILVNDGKENHLPDELFEHYPYRVDQIDIPHKGVSAARNAGMDFSNAEWINFCDFDDTYASVYSIRDVMNVLPSKDFDLLWVKLIKEDFKVDCDDLRYAPDKTTFVFVHGKYYRRSWLVEHGIRFDEDMPFQEDSLFNAYIVAILDHHRVGQIKTIFPSYVWCRRGESVTTSKGHRDPAAYFHFLRNWKLCDFYRDHLPEERLSDLVVRSCFDAYYMTHGVHVTDEMLERIRREFREYIGTYKGYYRKPADDIVTQIADISWGELEEASEVPKVGYETVTKWVNKMMGE